MWRTHKGEVRRFFYLSMLYMDVETFYRVNVALKRSDLHFNIQEIEQMYPYERDIYMLIAKEQQEDEMKDIGKK